MNASFMDGLLHTMGTNVPVQPALWLTQCWQTLGWSVVLAWLGITLVRRLSQNRALHAGTTLVLAAWTWLPGPWSPDYWLALAFQAPSVLTALLCGLMLVRAWRAVPGLHQQTFSRPARSYAMAWIGVVLGWALLLDTFALLPVQLYAWGTSPLAVVGLAVLGLLPWLASSPIRRVQGVEWTPLAAVLLFALARLPSGNVWDAVLDPWLWLVLQGMVLRKALKRY
ncbi:hypothetical protein [Rhodoferax saidenbachensis]|uniref:Uncharacterized protein n=1 Tax=Rhodoferax saidenbachensis TaxID=1484693 RepID=A0A1P8KD56_9BURK|nr:hypothetical protein [Rhodoferax saidenbachensis]APW43967.1 hypothetical protein RS694_16460 [Rhodoferax saidenbachensis]